MENSNTQDKLISSVSLAVHYLLNALNDAAFLCDYNGNVLLCSDVAVEFFSFRDKSRILGSDIQSFFSYESTDDAFSLFRNVSAKSEKKESAVFQVRVNAKEYKPIEVTFATLAHSSTSEKHILVTFRHASDSNTKSQQALRNENRLNKFTNILTEYYSNPIHRAENLLAFLGNSLGALTCSYSRIENEVPVNELQWESPFNQGLDPFMAAEPVYSLLARSTDKSLLIRKPSLNDIFDSIQYVDDGLVKSIIGLKVIVNGSINGMILIFFNSVFVLSEQEKDFLEKISRGYASFSNVGKSDSILSSNNLISKELLDSFVDSIYIIDSNGVFLDANKGAEELYGYSKEEVIGKTPEFFSAKDKNDFEQTAKYIKLASEGESQKFEWWGQKKSGEIFPKEIVLSQALVKDQKLVVAVCRDISERYKVEQELKKSNQELQETNISKDKFFSILAHDLKNPFQGLLGFIDLLYEDLEELTTEQIKEYLFNVRTASYHTYNLLENLLDWSRIQSGKMPFTPTVFDISSEIDSIINVLQTNANRKEIRLINEVLDNTFVEADRNMIHSVIQNLITNSIKFSNSNGKVTIRSRTPQNIQKNSETDIANHRQWLEVSVSDNGIGIPEEILPRLFQLNGQFSHAGTANEPGTGLGLVLCREMVEKNGGKIWAESIPDQGATFIFTLPMSN